MAAVIAGASPSVLAELAGTAAAGPCQTLQVPCTQSEASPADAKYTQLTLKQLGHCFHNGIYNILGWNWFSSIITKSSQ